MEKHEQEQEQEEDHNTDRDPDPDPNPNPPSKMQSPPREPDLEPITLSQNPPPATLPPRRQPELQPIRLSASPSPETLSPLSEPELEQHTTHNPPLGQEHLHHYNSTPESPALDFSHHEEEEEEEEEEEKHKQPPPVKPHISSAAAPDTESAPSNIGSARKILRTNLTILKRAKRDNTIKKSLLGFRVCGFVFSLVAFSVLAADKDRGWARDSFYRYKEFSYCLAVNVIVFVYSGFQSFDLAYRLTAGHRKPRQILRYYLDFSLDQILTYLLLSASSSAAVRVDDWQSNWGEDEFPDMAKASVALSFLAFVALGFSSLISGYALYNQKSR
ncbi:hypothetical protein WN943_009997 [Citrus x changshan-huyou]